MGEPEILPFGELSETLATPAGQKKILSTQSSWSVFRTCRKKYDYRYNRELVPITQDDIPLRMGSDWDTGLNILYTQGGIKALESFNTSEFRLELRAMLYAYMKRWAIEDGARECIAMQVPFEGDIVNPDSGSASRTFTLAGVVDGLFREKADGRLWIMESKTTSKIDAGYLEKLWMDWQITIYAAYIARTHGPVAGVIYNIAEKAGGRGRVAVTDSDGIKVVLDAAGGRVIKANGEPRQTGDKEKGWELQYREESDVEFAERLAKVYEDPAKFHREVILFDPADVTQTLGELWDLSKSWLEARSRGVWYRNTSQCFQWNKPCAYLSACRSRENPLVMESQFRHEEPHREIRGAKP